MLHPTDGSCVHGRRVRRHRRILRFDPKTALSEIYNLPKEGYASVRRHRPQWRAVGSRRTAAWVSFDRRQVQGAAQRPEG